MCCEDGKQLNFMYVLPQPEGNPIRLVVPTLLKSLGTIPTPRNPHYQPLAISLVWPTPQSYLVTKYLASQEYNRDIPLTLNIQQ
jgi:hypothetical protein